MGIIKQYIKGLIAGSKVYRHIEQQVLSHADYRNVANEYHGRQTESLYKRQSVVYQEKDITDWQRAVTAATDPDDPRRGLLYRFYQNLYLDEHLQTTIDNRVLPVQQSEYRLEDKSGTENEEAKKLLDRPWFLDLIRYCFLSQVQGPTLVDISNLNENMEISCIEEIPQSNFIAQSGIIITQESDTAGVSYKDGALEPYYVQFGNDWQLGMLNELAIVLMAKKLGMGSWMSYIDKYGVPPVFVVTQRMDATRRDELFDMMQNFRSNFFAVLQGNEQIQYGKEAGGSATNAFEPLMSRCDNQISKRLLGQTGTTTNGPYEGTSQVHERVERTRHEADKMLFMFYFNYVIIPKLVKISPVYKPLENLTLKWDDTETMSAKDYIDSIQKLSYTFDFNHKEVAKRTGLPILGQKISANNGGQSGGPMPGPPSEPGNTQKKKNETNTQVYGPVMAAGGLGKILERVAKLMYDKKVKAGQIDAQLFQETYKQLRESALKGWGENFFDYATPSYETAQAMRENLFWFSGAKSYQQLKELNARLTDETGKRVSFNEFKKAAQEINEKYNINYLTAEYDTAFSSAQMAGKWSGYEQDQKEYPNLKYVCVDDSHTRPEHALLNGIIKPLNDPFWNTYYPPNGFRCRCHVEQTNETESATVPNESIDYRFAHHVGKTGEVFTLMHPYFSMPQKELTRIRKETELNKLYAPYRKDTKSEVRINDFADLKDLEANIKNARIISSQLDMSIKIRPHINEDGIKNPEYLIDNKPGDLKNITSTGGIRHGLSSSYRQQCKYTVFNLDGLEKAGPAEIHRKLVGILAKDFKYKGMELIFKRGNKAVKVTWAHVTQGTDIDLLKRLEE